MHQGAAGVILYQPMVDRVEVLRVLAREAQQAARLVDEQQVFILEQDLYLGTARGGDKGIDDGGHGRLRAGNGGRSYSKRRRWANRDELASACPAGLVASD
ncbi:hypothetical protein D3C77_659370 [compost metagenome]